MIILTLLQSDLFASLERLMVSGIRSPQRLSMGTAVVGPHVIAATRLLSSNLKANLVYVSDGNVGDNIMDNGEASLEKRCDKMHVFWKSTEYFICVSFDDRLI
jgi:hypothetical protein